MNLSATIPLIVGGLFLATACSATSTTASTSSTEVAGRVETLYLYSSMFADSTTCGRHEVHVSDGAGEVLRVGQSTIAKSDLETDKYGNKVLTCVSTYSLTVPESAVYKVSLPGLEGADMYGEVSRTVNRTGAIVKVPPLGGNYRDNPGPKA